MRQRCLDPKHSAYKHYGAVGVTIHAAWNDFAAFLGDVGECPPDKSSIDRIDNALGYVPGNVRWATSAEQAVNRRATKYSAEIAADIRGRALNGDRLALIALRYGMHVEYVRLIVKGKRW